MYKPSLALDMATTKRRTSLYTQSKHRCFDDKCHVLYNLNSTKVYQTQLWIIWHLKCICCYCFRRTDTERRVFILKADLYYNYNQQNSWVHELYQKLALCLCRHLKVYDFLLVIVKSIRSILISSNLQRWPFTNVKHKCEPSASWCPQALWQQITMWCICRRCSIKYKLGFSRRATLTGKRGTLLVDSFVYDCNYGPEKPRLTPQLEVIIISWR